jgi:hypothetical protein
MSVVDANGNILTKAQLQAKTTAVVLPAQVTVNETIYESFTHPGAKDPETGMRRLFRAGSVVSQAVIDKIYADSAAAVSSLSPVSGLAAGGTAVTINGTGLLGTKGVKFDTVQATNVKVVSDTKVTCVTPPHAVGAVNVTVQDASGDVVKNAFFAYA